MSRADLSALIGSRICHDLISPLGAIGNGLELLQMGGHPGGPEVTLISRAVLGANARVRFFRIAFGAVSPGQSVAASELRSILQDSYIDSRITVTHDLPSGVERTEAKLLLLALLCLETALPFGGEIALHQLGQSWRILAQSERLKHDQSLWQLLQSGASEAELTPAQVQFGLLPQAAAQAGRELSLSISDHRIELRF